MESFICPVCKDTKLESTHIQEKIFNNQSSIVKKPYEQSQDP